MAKRMSNKMRELLGDISAKRKEMDDAISARDAEKAKKVKGELERLNDLYDAAEAAFDSERRAEIEDHDIDDEENTDAGNAAGKQTPKYNAKLFYKALTNGASLSDAEKAVVKNAMRRYNAGYTESTKEGGGYTVPDDLSSEIFKSIKDENSVRNLVYVEPVKSKTGTRVFRQGQAVKLYNTAEASEIKEMDNAEFDTVTYNQKKFAGIMTVSSELLEDSFANFTQELTNWLSEAARNTENRQVLYGVGGEKHCQGIISTPGAFIEISAPSTMSIGYLRKMKFSLKSQYRKTAKWLMNDDMFLEISELRDKEGHSYIQPDPKEDEQYRLLGSQIVILNDIETEEGKSTLLYGDFTKAYRMFTRRDFGIAFTDSAAGAFQTDTTKARGIERFDGRIMDNNAAVIAREVPVTAAADITTTEPTKDFGAADIAEYTEENLAYQTKKTLLILAEDLGIEGVKDTQNKSEIIAAIIAATKGDD